MIFFYFWFSFDRDGGFLHFLEAIKTDQIDNDKSYDVTAT